MNASSASFYRSITGIFIMAALWSLMGTSHAVAPAKPVNVKVEFSRAGYKLNSSNQSILDISGNTQTFVVKWESKSVDEEGFRVNVTGALKGSYLVNAGSQSAMLPGQAGLAAGLKLNFTVSAWKRNGTVIESATSAATSFTIPEGTVAGNLAAPSALAATNFAVTTVLTPVPIVDDGSIVLNWNDNSTAELYNQILLREVRNPVVSFSHVGYLDFTTFGVSSQKLSLGLLPSTDYEFQIRATTENPSGSNPVFSTTTFQSNTAIIRTPPLTPPTSLSAEVIREDLVRLSWRDNSNNETGYDIQSKSGGGSAPFVSLGSVGRNVTSVNVPVNQGTTLEWRVLAIYRYTPPGSNTATTISSAASNSVTRSTSFPAPSEVTAVTSGQARSINLTWKDNSDSEYGYNIYTRPLNGTTWFFARAVRAGVTKISVNTRATGTNDANGKPTFIDLEVGTTHEFVVRTVDSSEAIFSVDSNTALAAANHGFTSRLYAPVQAGVNFSYEVTTSNGTIPADLVVTGLPSGLTFSNTTGFITGSPSESGLFQALLTSPTATAALILRVLPASVQPSVPVPFPDRTLGINGILDIPLAGRFTDVNSEMAVRMETTKGNIDILLFPSVAPKAVANFMAYVNAGDYNGLAFHRLVTGFVLQAGSLKAVREPRTFTSVPSRLHVENEPGISHLEGTIGAAKIGARSSSANEASKKAYAEAYAALNPKPSGLADKLTDEDFGYVGDPDSATTDFFFNLADNSDNLDLQNGGFTAFGRVATPSLAVINAIKALPQGNYLNGNTTDNYNASLDKRITVNGNLVEYRDIPMNVPVPSTAQNAPPPAAELTEMDITKTVRITKVTAIPTLTYSATVATSPVGIVSATLTGSTLRLKGLKEGSTIVTVGAQDLDSSTPKTVEFDVTVTKGHLAVAITKQPVTQSVVSGSNATLSVTATGTAPITYTWRKDGFILNSATGPTLTLSNVQPSDQGLYDVLVGNATTTLSSNRVRLDITEAPSVSPNLTPRLVEVGKPLTLSTFIDGSPVPTITWKKGATSIRGVSSLQPDGRVATSYTVPLAKLTDAGDYSVSAKNAAPPVSSNSVNVRVVDKTSTTRIVGPNVPVTLTAAFAGIAQSYQWKHNGVNIPEGINGFTGTNLKDLKIARTSNGDSTTSPFGHSGRYTCLISLTDGLGMVETGPINLAVVIRPVLPRYLIGNDALPNGFIGVDYSATLPYSKLVLHTPSSFTFATPPPGLKLNPLTGVISGKPTKAGIYPFSATAYNAAGGHSYPTSTGQIVISPLPAATIGTLSATISASPVLNDNKGGRLDITTLDTGAYTAKLTLGKTIFSAVGTLSAGTGLYNPFTATFQSRISIPRKGLSTLTLVFEIDSDGGYVSGTLNDGANTASISGIRQFWDSIWSPCPYTTPTGRPYHLGLDLASSDVGKDEVPQGSGYMRMTVSTKGVATMSGLLADGTSITGSSMVGPTGEAFFFQMLYLNTGSHLATLDIGDSNIGTASEIKLRVAGQSRWIKDVQPATARNYRIGIPETFINILGTNYTIPGTGSLVMGLPIIPTTVTSTANVEVEFSEGGLNPALDQPDVAILLSKTHGVSYPLGRNASSTFSVVLSTGSYSGSFTLADLRKVSYQGLIIPFIPATPAQRDSNGNVVQNEIPAIGAKGVGYFLMPELLPSLTTSKINSGKVELLPTPLQIVSQPAPATQAVNPASNVTYSVFIDPAAQGTVTYLWRKDGNTISGATTATLNLAAVTEATQGTYDCVISNGAATITSSPAVLNINDPVTSVVASRTPSTTSVASGTVVTFSVTAQGTAPLRYQWRANSSPITGETSATLSITATAGSTYDVIVSNIASNPGITSNPVSLIVTTP